MNKTELIQKYDFLREPAGDQRTPYPMFGVECDDGWLGILDELFEKIETVVKREKLHDFEISQIKEKFATLRIYVHGGNDEIEALIRVAEKQSAVTCEECGRPGKLRKGGWMATLCDCCHEMESEDWL